MTWGIIVLGAVLCGGAVFATVWYHVAHITYDIAADTHAAFTTDGCTLFFDGTWRDCCVRHDWVYWQGGSAVDRVYADRTLRACITAYTHNRVLGTVMYGAVRMGGVPYVATPWRWGYGWSFGRGYDPLLAP